MKKKEFKKMLKKENHPIMKGRIYEIIFTILFLLICLVMTIFVSKNILLSSKMLVFDFLLIIIALPYWIVDIKRDKKIKEMYEYYQKENKILEVEDHTKQMKIMLIIEIICVLFVGFVVTTKYIFNKEPLSIDPTEPYILSLKNGEQIELEEYQFDHNQFSLSVPLDFVAMNEELIEKKYPNGNPPSYVLTNENATINLAVNITNDPLKNSQVKSYVALMEEQLKEFTEIIDTRFFERDGHEIGEIKFISKAVDTDIYNHMIVFSDNDVLKIVSFNCTIELKENWQSVGEYIMNSLTLK